MGCDDAALADGALDEIGDLEKRSFSHHTGSVPMRRGLGTCCIGGGRRRAGIPGAASLTTRPPGRERRRHCAEPGGLVRRCDSALGAEVVARRFLAPPRDASMDRREAHRPAGVSRLRERGRLSQITERSGRTTLSKTTRRLPEARMPRGRIPPAKAAATPP
jgi:hypothetical protein